MFPSPQDITRNTGGLRLRRAIAVFGACALSLGLAIASAPDVRAQDDAVRVFPADGMLGVDAGTPIGAYFDREMDIDSLVAAFSLAPPVAGDAVAQGTSGFAFNPDEPLAAETMYTARLDAAIVRDARGAPVLERTLVWSFTTGTDSQRVSFPGALPLRFARASGDRAVYVNAGYPRHTLDFALYPIDLAGFAERYGLLRPWELNPIDLAGLTPVESWTARVVNGDRTDWPRLPSAVAPGLYVLDARSDRVGDAQALVLLGDRAVVAKQGLNGVTAWVTEYPGGGATAGATVAIHAADGAELATGVSDIGGVARDLRAPDGTAPAFVVARKGSDIALAGLDDVWRSSYGWGWWRAPGEISGAGGAAARVAGHVHTDRPIYRPGHTVHWKATLRRISDSADGYAPLGAGEAVSITVRDPAGNAAHRQTADPDAFGSVHGSLPLDDDAPLGYWRIEVTARGQTSTQQFQVEAYVKPDFEVQVSTDRPWYVRGDTARVTVDAAYYFGKPVAGGQVVLRVYEGWYWRGGESPREEIEGVLDTDGNWSADIELPGREGETLPLWFEAEVVDANRRPVIAEAAATLHPAAFALRLEAERFGDEAGAPIVRTVTALDHDGLPRPGVEVTIEVRRYERRGYITLATKTAVTGEDGSARVTFGGLETGWFQLRAAAVDERGHPVEAWSYAWLWDAMYPWPWYGGLELSLDKTEYAPGDTATLLIRSPVTGTLALVTVERDTVRDEYVVPLDGPATVKLPIRPEHAPNAEIHVGVWQPEDDSYSTVEARFLTASIGLVVPATDRRLSVSVTPDAAEHGPGERAAFTISVADAAGLPVRGQFSMALVDKAVLALAADTSGDIFDAFWSGWPNGVGTFDTLSAGIGYGGWPIEDRGGGPGGPEPAPSPEPGDGADEEPTIVPRREFPDTAFWRADLVTDDAGQATVELDLPDSLTTWVAIVRAIDVNARAGQDRSEVVVSKPVQADLALPRFAVQGDRFALDLLARNYSTPGASLAGDCTLEAPGLVTLDPGPRALDLPFGETGVARWSAVASQLGTGTVRGTLLTSAEDDAIELPFEVAPFAVPERFVLAGSTETEAVETVEIPYDAMPSASSVEVRLSPGAALGVLDGIEELIGYPYGCVEQTMSRMLPNAVVGRLVEELGIEAPDVSEELPAHMTLGLQKLYGFQNGDGSWGWWHDSEAAGRTYITAYVLHGLGLSQAAGYDIDVDVIERGATWLESNLAGEGDARLRAYGVFVLGELGRHQTEMATGLAERTAGLDAFALAALALALDSAGEDTLAEAVLNALVERADVSATTAFWPLETSGGRWDHYHWRTMASAEKNTGAALLALARLRPEGELSPKAARWLLEHRWGRGWSSTQATAFAILGLTDYLSSSGELEANYTWSVALGDEVLATGAVSPDTIFDPLPPVIVTGSDLEPGSHALRLTKSGSGSLFYTVVGDMRRYSDGFAPAEADGLGIELRREYLAVTGAPPPAEGWAVGDVLNVRVTLTTREDLWYVLVEDMLPAGIEGLNERLATESDRDPGGRPPWEWRWWGYERKEVRDDRVAFFATRLPAGQHVFEYAARAITPGTFSARPAEAYAMYRPEIWGRSSSEQVSIAPRRVVARPPLAGDFDRDCRLTSFDASLVAAAWPAGDDGRRDLDGNGTVGAADIALAAARGAGGTACGDAPPAHPGRAGTLELRLEAVGEPMGDRVRALIRSDAALPVAAWEIALELPSGVTLDAFASGNQAPGATLKLAADGADPGTRDVRFGAWSALSESDPAGDILAEITLRVGWGADSGAVRLTGAEIADGRGAAYDVTADGRPLSPPRPVWKLRLPWLAKGAGPTP